MKNKTLSVFSLAALSLQLAIPTVIAAGVCSVTALDTVAGLGTQVTVSSCESSATETLAMSGPSNQNYTQTIALDASGNALTLIPSKYTVTAGHYILTLAGASASFTVLADRADDDASTLTVSRQSIADDGKDNTTVTAILRDRYDNPVSGRPLALVASRVNDEVDAQSKQTDDSGRFLWTLKSTEPGAASLSVYDIAGGRTMKMKATVTVGGTAGSPLLASLTGFEQGGDATTSAQTSSAPLAASTTDLINTNPDAVIDHFELSLPQNATDVKANDLFGITIRAMRGTDLVRGYIGTLTVKSSDSEADLPKKGEDPRNPDLGRIDMRDVDQGERNVPLAFVLRAGGQQTITVADKQNPAITGTLTLNVTQAGSTGTAQIVILDPKDRATIKGGPVMLQGHAPSLVNLKVKGGSQDVSGESDQEGVFRISVPINPEDKEVTLFVASENGTYESAPVHILIDNVPPAIQTISLNPTETKASQTTVISAQSEAGLASVTAVSGTQTVKMTEGSGGLYTGTLTAPAQEGVYDITVTATDAAGNAATMLTKWTVAVTTFPVVQSVTAESQPAAVKLSWAAVTGPVAEYRIYIAEDSDPTNYLYSIETKKPVTSATIKDLPLGKTYQFSLTAVSTEGMESSEKSQPASASPLGMSLTAVPGVDSLMLQWTGIPNLPLDHYIVQYGTAPGEYPEMRTVNGQANSFLVHDLINGVTYELKLTPVTVTGKQLDELAAIVHGTPGGNGFTAGATDPVPTDIMGHPGAPIQQILPQQQHLNNVPSNPSSGFPTYVLGFLFLISLMGVLQWRHVRAEKKMAGEFLALMQERYHS